MTKLADLSREIGELTASFAGLVKAFDDRTETDREHRKKVYDHFATVERTTSEATMNAAAAMRGVSDVGARVGKLEETVQAIGVEVGACTTAIGEMKPVVEAAELSQQRSRVLGWLYDHARPLLGAALGALAAAAGGYYFGSGQH